MTYSYQRISFEKMRMSHKWQFTVTLLQIVVLWCALLSTWGPIPTSQDKESFRQSFRTNQVGILILGILMKKYLFSDFSS